MKNIIKSTVLFFAFAIFISCDETDDHSTTNGDTSNTTINGDTSKPKNEIDKVITIVDAGVDLVKDIKEISDKNVEIRNANKDRLWVYKIGTAINDDGLAGKAYEKIKDIPNLYVFKKGKNEYYIIKDDGYSTEEQLTDSLGSTKKLVANYTTDRVIPLDLSLECTSRKQPTKDDPIRYKMEREKKEVECRVCE